MSRITVFTPTYNRKELLIRLYESLINQTNQDFEWIVIDDESTDKTDEWIEPLFCTAPFAIKYKKINHGGKHRAINVGISLSETEYFFVVDSDDYLPEDAIDRVLSWVNDIDDDEEIAGVAGLIVDIQGHTVGQAPAVERGQYIECTNLERYRKHLNGDKAEVYKTKILKKYPFPEYKNENFITERIVWDKIASDGYKIRWYNQPIYICEYQESGLSNSGANMMKGHLDNYKGYLAFINQGIRVMEPLEGVTYFREYNHVAKRRKLSIAQRASELNMSTIAFMSFLYIKMPLLYLQRKLFMSRLARHGNFH